MMHAVQKFRAAMASRLRDMIQLRPTHLGEDERGQVLVIGLVVCIGLVMMAISVANVGIMVAEKIHLQDSVDAAAYSGAVVEARYMNLSAYINRAMVANYNSMAFNTALWAVIDADDHGIATIIALLYQISDLLLLIPFLEEFGPVVDEVADVLRDFVHHPLHTLLHYMNDFFAQDDDARDMNQYIEMFNIDILTMYSGLLYAATQSVRYEVVQDVAHKMDPDVLTTSVLGLGAEAVSYDELARASDWVIRDADARSSIFKSFNKSFDKMMSEPDETDDNPLLLAAVTEASLDKFTGIRTREGDDDLLRNFNLGNIIPADGAIEFILDAECEITSLGFADCDADVELVLGAAAREGQEDKAFDDKVPTIARRRMREVNFFGIDFRLDGIKVFGIDVSSALESAFGKNGHTSGELKNDVAMMGNAVDFIDRFDSGRALECIFAGCIPKGLNYLNALEALPVPFDWHWDGSFDGIEPVNAWEVIPPGAGQAALVEYIAEVASEGMEKGVPKYDWQVDLDNVGFQNYIYPEDGAAERPEGTSGGGEDNKLTGPSIAVVGVKSKDKIPNIQGLKDNRGRGLGNEYSMSAIARAQVYYLRSPNRPEEKPSSFNPHWVARLAPIESEDTPALLRKGLPFVSSMGVPISPTH